VERLLNQHGFEYPYREVLDELRPPDLTIGNLETPVSRRGSPVQKEYAYRSPPEALPALVQAGFDVVNLANNHVLDYGENALLDTLDYLDQAGLRHVGAGRDADNAFQPAVVEKNGVRIAFLGFSRVVPFVSWKAGKGHPGVADTYEETRPVQAIEQAKRDADLVVVIVHWGIEREDRPEDYQVRLARKYIDAGADLVIGGHPHVLQGLEFYKGKWIAYSLGNFIFTTNSYSKTLETVILHASCTRDGDCSLQAVPVFTRWAQPKVMDPEAGRELLDRLAGISSGIRIGPDGKILPVLPAR
jgi:poly-gamma-glutamate synthesis protein (capsule biosynthesis protein)